jgi:beta-glucanase (GH16 family)
MKKLLLGALMLLLSICVNAQTYTQVWSSEFNGSIGSDWVFETGGGGWGNGELQYYQQANATISNNQLVIAAKKQSVGGYAYTSARMKTQGKKSWKFGKVEASIKVPSVQGLWPAFWMLGDNISSVGWPSCGEIDIMEQVNTSTTNYGTIHWNSGGHVSYGGSINTSGGAFHNYSIVWSTSSITWYVDGAQYFVANIANGINNTGCFQNNFFILLNMAVGGTWPGNTIGALPANYYVDYVRVSQAGSTPPPPPPATTQTIQAESYGSMAGVQLENTSDAGGGQNVGWIDANDWMAYNNINIPTSGTYTIEYRVASLSGGSKIQLEKAGGSPVYGSITVPSTGGWQTWTTIKHTVTLTAGVQGFGIKALTGGFNLNWFAITPGVKSASIDLSVPGTTDSAEPMLLYPNPVTNNTLNIKLNNYDSESNINVSLYDMSGRVVLTKTLNSNNDNINTNMLKPGAYSVMVTNGGNIYSQRVLVR